MGVINQLITGGAPPCIKNGDSSYKMLEFSMANCECSSPRIVGSLGGVVQVFRADHITQTSHLPSGKLSHNYGKSPFFMGKSPFFMGKSHYFYSHGFNSEVIKS